MNEENKKVEKAELTDEQVEKATGGANSFSCPSCRKTITYYTATRPTRCPYCNVYIPPLKIIRR